MCGIAVYFGPGPFDAGPVRRALQHRGPDGGGVWAGEMGLGARLVLVHARLSILDLSDAAAQPMVDAETGNVIVYNGELYNFRALRAELEACGDRVRSTGDTEVMLRGYARWGAEVFAKADGMYAVAILDARRRRLVVARDPMGIKPLYQTRLADGGLMLASEVRALRVAAGFRGEVDPEAVADYLRLGSFQEPRALYAGVRAFPPAHVGEVRLDEGVPATLRHRPVWEPERFAAAAGGPVAGWEREHGAWLREVVGEQLVSDVPVGLFLSGGIDSTALLEALPAVERGRVTAFTLGGAEVTERDESAVAAATAAAAGVRHVVVRPPGEELTRWVRDGLAAMDQPSCDGINLYLVSRASRQANLVVVLGGTGANELHGAYGHAAQLAGLVRLFGQFGWMAPVFAPGVAGLLRRWRGPVTAERFELLRREVRVAWRLTHERRRFFTETQVAEFWPAARDFNPRWHPPWTDDAAFLELSLEEQVRQTEVRGYLLNTLLRDADWATMANQQEFRVPFLGRRYVERVLSLPWRAVAEGEAGPKPALRAFLGREQLQRVSGPKSGFTLNYRDWILGPMRPVAEAALETLRERLGFTDPGMVVRRLEADGSQKLARRVWALVALGAWLAAARGERAG